jgi:hypothetical protein
MGASRDGGKPTERDVMNYSEPVGPKRNYPAAPGLAGGDNYGCCGTQGKSSVGASVGGSVGLQNGGDKVRMNGGAQGKR